MTEACAAIETRYFKRAKHLLKLAAEEDPGDDRVLYTTGLMQLGRHNFGSALPLFEEILERGPTFANSEEAFYSYGRCLEGVGDLIGAREAYRAHLLLDPDHGETHLRLALFAMEEGDLEEARRCIEEARTAFWAHPEGTAGIARVYALKGDVHLQAGELELARDSFLKGLRVDPTNNRCRYRLGRVCSLLGDEQGAERALRRFTGTRPERPR